VTQNIESENAITYLLT